MIVQFKEKYEFLSNFYENIIEYNGLIFDNNEAAFQAQKSLNADVRIRFIHLGPSKAKYLGRKIKLRPNWDYVKDKIMEDLVRIKFNDSYLKLLLISTGDEELIEGNWWGDKYWGVCNGEGENKLDKILMKVRDELK